MPLHKSSDIKLGLLENLDLANVAILDGEDAAGLSRNLFSDGRRNEFLDKRLEVPLGAKFVHHLNHLCSNGSGLSRLCVASGLDLILLGLCKGNAKHADDVSIGSTAIDVCFNNGLLLANKGAKFIASHVHAMEIHQTVVSLNVFDTKFDFAIRECFILVEIGETHFNDTSLEVVRSNLGTLCLGNESLSTVLLRKHGGSNELVPLLLEKGINRLFTGALLALCQSLVLAL